MGGSNWTLRNQAKQANSPPLKEGEGGFSALMFQAGE